MSKIQMKTARVMAKAALIVGRLWRRTWRGLSRRMDEPTCSGTTSASPDARPSRSASTSIPGVAFGEHPHPGEEIIYVLEGALEYQIEGKPPVTLKAGDVLYPGRNDPFGQECRQRYRSELATYIVEKGKPLLTLVK